MMLLVSHWAPPQVANMGTLTRYGGYQGNKIPGSTQSIQQAAIHAIPVYTIKRNHLTLLPNLCYLLKLKNYYRHRYQRSCLRLFHYLFQLFARIFSTHLSPLLQMVLLFGLFTYMDPSILESCMIFYKIFVFHTPPNSPGHASLPHPTQSRSPSTTV
jgi:hypothetical protein